MIIWDSKTKQYNHLSFLHLFTLICNTLSDTQDNHGQTEKDK
jgi:hypothetical protein